jgi:hypothetical protein
LVALSRGNTLKISTYLFIALALNMPALIFAEDYGPQRRLISEYLKANKIEEIKQLPISNLAVPITEREVYLWPQEEMMIGFLVGKYDYFLDSKYATQRHQAANLIRQKLRSKPEEVQIPYDGLVETLYIYTKSQYPQILKVLRAAKLKDDERDFILLVLKDFYHDENIVDFKQTAINEVAKAYIQSYPKSPYSSIAARMNREYREEKWPWEFSLGYGVGSFQGSAKNYLGNIGYLTSDFNFYKNDLFFGWYSRIGYNASEVKQGFLNGGPWQQGDSISTYVGMDFDLGYRFSIFNRFYIKPFGGMGFNLYKGADYNSDSGYVSPFLGSLDVNLGLFFDIRIYSTPRSSRLPSDLETSYVILRAKFTYQHPVVGRDGVLSGDIYYFAVQLGMVFKKYERIRLL